MEIKKVLNLLNNQYFKSLKRFEKMYNLNKTFFKVELKEINNDYLKLVSAVINRDAYGLDLNTNWVYTCATINEKNELRILIDSIPTNY